jgi:hypothetical protein
MEDTKLKYDCKNYYDKVTYGLRIKDNNRFFELIKFQNYEKNGKILNC